MASDRSNNNNNNNNNSSSNGGGGSSRNPFKMQNNKSSSNSQNNNSEKTGYRWTDLSTKLIQGNRERNPGVSRSSSADELSIDHLGYNSISGQIREAVDESQSLFEFLGKAWSIVTNTAAISILAGVHAFIPFGMMMIGVKHLEDCPKQPNLPIYLFVGGCVGLLKNAMVILSLIRKRRSELEIAAESSGKDVQSPVSASRASFYSGLVITAFLIGWFAYGNYLTWTIFQPNYKMPLANPKDWCAKTAYFFALVHFVIVYALIILYIVTMIVLIICHRCMMSTWRENDF